MNGYKRTHYCGTLTKANAGQTVQLSGWVQRTRDLGGVVFVWLRDREGMVQLVFDDTVCDEATLKLGKSLRGEYVVTAVGEVRERMGAEPGDILFFVADKKAVALQALGALRLEIAKKRDLIDHNRYDLFWVTEFPLFEYSEEEERYVAMHHPFTSWMEEDEELLETAPDQVRAKAYDLVLNGIEMGSGSIRIHRSDMQSRMFDMIGLSPEEAKHRFGFLLEAFKYGTPPHGGFAFGVDRLVMILTGSENLREVVAFPKAQNANCLMMQTPSDVQEEQLKMLHIRVADDEQE